MFDIKSEDESGISDKVYSHINTVHPSGIGE